MKNEKTLIILKPDAVRRRLAGEILSRFERKGFKILASKFMLASEELVKEHYAEHKDKPFFDDLIAYFTSGTILIFVFEGDDAIEISRKLIGATKAKDAMLGSIRGDYALGDTENLVHASDCPESFKKELVIWFPEYANYID